MEIRKSYMTPEVDVVLLKPVPLLTASFSEEIESSDPITDPEDILSIQLDIPIFQ